MTARASQGTGGFSAAERWVIAACAISMLIVQMDWFALNLAIPAIARDFKEASTDLHWVVSGYMISIGAVMVTGGRLADIFGSRRIIVWGLAIFGLLSIACGASTSASWLIPARVIQGVGAALIFPAAIGTAIGPFVGGAFSEYWTWRGVFLINVPLCIIAILLMLRFVEETRDDAAARHIDVLGILTITGGLVCISIAFDRGEAWGWLSPATLGTLIGGIGLVGAFIAVESRVRSPLVDLGLFRNRVFDAIVIGGSLSNVVFCLVAVFSALYLQQARGFSPFQSGVIFLALSAGSGSASYFSGKLAERFSAARLMATGLLISTAGIVGLTSVESLWLYVPLFLLTGAGVGLAWALANVATQAAVRPSEAGEASGVTLTCLVMLGAVSVAIAAAMLELLSGSVAGAASDAPALNTILRAGAVLAVGGGVVLLAVGPPRAQAHEAVGPGSLGTAR